MCIYIYTHTYYTILGIQAAGVDSTLYSSLLCNL